MESVTVTREEVYDFLSTIQSSGFGYGNGSGNGNCNCDGNGDGNGNDYFYGDPDCNGSGYATSDGYGDGNNDGNGSGYALGYGYGLGNGSGCGYRKGDCYCDSCGDIKAINGNIIDYIDGVRTIITHIHGNIASGYIVKSDLTLEPCYIAKTGNSFAHGKTVKEAIKDVEEKEQQKIPIEKRIEMFKEHFENPDAEHTGKEFYNWHHILTGSCRMGRDEFCKANGIDLERKYTVTFFLEITENAYGGDVIRKVIESYNRKEE